MSGPTTRSTTQREASNTTHKEAAAVHTTTPLKPSTVPTKPSMAAADIAQNPAPQKFPTTSETTAGNAEQVPNTQFKYVTPIESAALLDRVTHKAMDTSIQLSLRELLAISPDIRKVMKEQISTKQIVPHGSVTTTPAQVGVVNTLMAALPERTDGLVVANHSEKLRAIDVVLNGTRTVEAIMDEGSQIIGLRRDIWEDIGLPVRRDHLVTMETANSALETSVGLLQDLKLTVGGYNFYVQVQVVENAAYEMLLGLPFHVLTQGSTKFFGDGSSHLTLNDPNTGAVIMIPTRERNKTAKSVDTNFLSGF